MLRPILTFCLVLLCTFCFSQTMEFKVSSPYPFTECGYKIIARVIVTADNGEEEVIELQEAEVMPGVSAHIKCEIPDGRTFERITFTAIAHGSNAEFKNLSNSFEVREKSCKLTENTATFWKPVSDFEYHIWEGLITDVQIKTVKTSTEGN